jgi:hypothetical protein
MSNVSTVNWLANCAATCSYDAQSPSPEGTNTTCGPSPRCSQYQSMPSVLCSNRRTDSTLNPRVALNEASCWSHESYHLRIAPLRVSANAVIDGLRGSARAFPESVMTARGFDKSAPRGHGAKRASHRRVSRAFQSVAAS